jgi:capsular exopolysaccharide synthesis family protein
LRLCKRERAQLAEQLGNLHPDMIKVDTAIAASERRLNTEIAKIVDGIRSDYRAAQANERGLLAALQEQKKEVIALNRDAIGYGALQRDATSTQQIFESLLQRVKEADLSGELQANNVRIVDRADVPRAPVLPRTQLNLILAFLSACVLGVGLSFGLDYFRPRLVAPNEIGASLGTSIAWRRSERTRAETWCRGHPSGGVSSSFPEAFRSIRSRLLLSADGAGVRSLVITSTGVGEGKTLVAGNLAISMALVGRRVLLVDGDLRRSRIHSLFGVPDSPGLSDLVAGNEEPMTAIRQSAIGGLFILPAGVYRGSASDLFEAAHLQSLVEQLASNFDLVIIDSPPVMAVADAAIIANAASSVLFVVGAGVKREVAKAALQRLAAAQAHVIGAVFNKADANPRANEYSPLLSGRRQRRRWRAAAKNDTSRSPSIGLNVSISGHRADISDLPEVPWESSLRCFGTDTPRRNDRGLRYRLPPSPPVVLGCQPSAGRTDRKSIWEHRQRCDIVARNFFAARSVCARHSRLTRWHPDVHLPGLPPQGMLKFAEGAYKSHLRRCCCSKFRRGSSTRTPRWDSVSTPVIAPGNSRT